MRRLALVGVVVAALAAPGSRALGRPVRLDDRSFEPLDPCDHGAWKRIERCLAKHGASSIAYQSDGMKIIRLEHRPPSVGAQLILYAQRGKTWKRGGLSAFTNANTQLIGIAPHTTPHGPGIRLDLGSTITTTISTGTASSRGLLRRVFTTVCWADGGTCRSVMTSCEAYVRGRVFWAFRGELVWHPTLGLRLRGAATLSGGACRPPPSMLLDDSTP